MSLQEIENQIESLSPAEFEELSQWIAERHAAAPQAKHALDVLFENAGCVSMPPDWAEEHDHYLYGAPRHHAEKES